MLKGCSQGTLCQTVKCPELQLFRILCFGGVVFDLQTGQYLALVLLLVCTAKDSC